ncbi:hypothetical protein CXB41_07060 [Pseudomonas syringae pv. syringae]|nr:hypothetical protein CXB41_07060 [Pseudomonas syringae pv. syringae]
MPWIPCTCGAFSGIELASSRASSLPRDLRITVRAEHGHDGDLIDDYRSSRSSVAMPFVTLRVTSLRSAIRTNRSALTHPLATDCPVHCCRPVR